VHGEAGATGAAVVHGDAGAMVVGAGVVVRHTQQSSFVHPVTAHTGSPATFVKGAGGHVKVEHCKCVVVVHGVVVMHTQQSSFVHPVTAQTASPGILVQGAGGHAKVEHCKCVVVVHGVVVGCRQQSSADSVPCRLYACGRATHPAGHVKLVQVGGGGGGGGAAVVHGDATGAGAAVVHGLEEETGRTIHAKRSARVNIMSAMELQGLKVEDFR